MECLGIKEKLSAYIDGMLNPDEKALLEEHLKSCSECSAVLADMRKTINHIKNMEEVEPPTWLTQKIMARVRLETVPEKNILRRLFSPFHIKVPIGAVATIAIALTTIYIFKAVQPDIQFSKIPTEGTPLSAPSSPDAGKKTPEPSDVTAKIKTAKPVISRDEVSSSGSGYIQGGKQPEQTAPETKLSKDLSASLLAEKEKPAASFAPSPPSAYKDEKHIGTGQPIPAGETEVSKKYDHAAKSPAPLVQQTDISASAGAPASEGMKYKTAQMREKKFESKSAIRDSGDKISKKITVAAGKKTYVQGDSIRITVLNISDSDVSIVDRKFIDAGFASIEIMTPEGNWRGIELYTSANVITNKTLKPGENHVYIWKTSGYNRPDTIAAPGIYRICFNEQACTDSFEIKGR